MLSFQSTRVAAVAQAWAISGAFEVGDPAGWRAGPTAAPLPSDPSDGSTDGPRGPCQTARHRATVLRGLTGRAASPLAKTKPRQVVAVVVGRSARPLSIGGQGRHPIRSTTECFTMPTFDPTSVPQATLKTMAKRMHRHPQAHGLSLSQCQEVLARTFGHAHWHALSTHARPDRSAELLSDPHQRRVLYDTLRLGLDGRRPIGEILDSVRTCAQRAGRAGWVDLVDALKRATQDGTAAFAPFGFSAALAVQVQPFSPIEAMLLRSATLANTIDEGLDVALLEAAKVAAQSAAPEVAA